MAVHRLTRYEPPELVAAWDEHYQGCSTCQAATSHRSACPEGVRRHEAMVRAAVAAAGREATPWMQRLELGEIGTAAHLEEWRHEAVRAGATTVDAVDTSTWQGAFPWGEAVAAGVGLGIAKASEGNGYQDPQWTHSVAALLAPGPLIGGSYHFARPDLGSTPQAEAAWYLSRHPSACFDPHVPWVFSLDAESAGGTAAWCYAFLSTVALKTGYSAFFYSFANWITSRSVQAFGSPLWIAWPNPGPPPALGWPTVTMHQYGTRQFSVGAVDADRFLGDISALLTLAGAGGTVIPKESDMRVLQCDTLPGLWITDGPYRRYVGSVHPELDELLSLAGQAAPIKVSAATLTAMQSVRPGSVVDPAQADFDPAAWKAAEDRILAAVATAPAVDVVALAAALAPHLTATVDEAKLAADLAAVLPAADAAAVRSALAKALSG